MTFIAFGLGSFITALNYPHEERYQPYRYAADEPQQVNPSLPRPANAKSLEYREPCKEPKGSNESDLCAQWRAAKAGEESAIWAKRGFWVTVAGILGLLATIIQGRIALSRASEANMIARGIGETQTRAYVSIESLEARKAKVGSGFVFRVHARNSGNSPALAAQLLIQVVGKDGTLYPVVPDEEHNVPAQSVVEFAYGYFNDDVRGWGGIVVIVTIAYADVFGGLHQIKERFADLTDEWTEADFVKLTPGRHVASYIRSTEKK